MEHIQIIKGLERKASEIEVWLADYQKQSDQRQTDLVHIRATIALMKPSGGSSTSVPVMSVARIFKRGELFERCVALLANAPSGELDTSELATACLKAKDLDHDDRGLRRAMTQQIVQVFHVRKKDGPIVAAGKRGATRVWRLSGRC
jgi:hypothetical protein